jgi:hypothetical protein
MLNYQRIFNRLRQSICHALLAVKRSRAVEISMAPMGGFDMDGQRGCPGDENNNDKKMIIQLAKMGMVADCS